MTPDVAAFTSALTAIGATVATDDGESLTVEGMTAPKIGDLGAREGLRIHELVPITASLEDAFMELTEDEVEFRPSTSRWHRAAGREGMTEMPETIEATLPGHYRLKHVVKSEALKILTVPSTAITLGLTVVAGLLVTGLVTHHAAYRGIPASTRPRRR